jgi:hypothetical protein
LLRETALAWRRRCSSQPQVAMQKHSTILIFLYYL